MTNKTKWAIDQSHSEISFKVRHLMIAHVKGSFKIFDANIYTTGKDFKTAEIDVWIDPASISTGDENRDEHLKNADFFDVENHKQITFVSSTIGKPREDGNHELWGEITINGKTKNLKLNVQFGGILNDPWGNEKAGFTVSGKINRTDFGLVWNTTLETGGFMVSDEIIIACEMELINTTPTAMTMELIDITETTKIQTMKPSDKDQPEKTSTRPNYSADHTSKDNDADHTSPENNATSTTTAAVTTTDNTAQNNVSTSN